jgi:hypothetical protein
VQVWNLPDIGSETKAKGGEEDEKVPAEPARVRTVDLPGHRAAIRGIALASDDGLAAVVAGPALKLWNPKTGACVRTVPTGNGRCVLFAPGLNFTGRKGRGRGRGGQGV